MRRRLSVDDLLGYVHRVVDGDGETDAGVIARVGRDQRVDADELTVLINQSTAGVARVDGRVGLDHVGIDRVVAGASSVRVGRTVHDLRTAGGGHDSGRNRLLEAEGTADGHNPLADDKVIRVSQLDGGKPRSVLRLQHRDVRAGVGANQFSIVGFARNGHLVSASAFDHVIVSDDVAVGGQDDARAERALNQAIT